MTVCTEKQCVLSPLGLCMFPLPVAGSGQTDHFSLFGHCYYYMKHYCLEQSKYQKWHQLTSSFFHAASLNKDLLFGIRKIYKIHVKKSICCQSLECHYKI